MTAEREGLADEIARVLFDHVDSYCTEGFGYSDPDTREERMRGCLHLAATLADLLAARDRRVRAEALREAADAWPYEVNAETIRREIATLDLRDIPPEYRVDDWLRDRADRIEAKG